MKVLDEDEEGGKESVGRVSFQFKSRIPLNFFEAATVLTTSDHLELAACCCSVSLDTRFSADSVGDAKKASHSLPFTSVFLRPALSLQRRLDALIAALPATPHHLSREHLSMASLLVSASLASQGQAC